MEPLGKAGLKTTAIPKRSRAGRPINGRGPGLRLPLIQTKSRQFRVKGSGLGFRVGFRV